MLRSSLPVLQITWNENIDHVTPIATLRQKLPCRNMAIKIDESGELWADYTRASAYPRYSPERLLWSKASDSDRTSTTSMFSMMGAFDQSPGPVGGGTSRFLRLSPSGLFVFISEHFACEPARPVDEKRS